MQTESRHRMWTAIGVLSGFLFVVFWIAICVILGRHSVMETRERAEARRNEPAWGPSSEPKPEPVKVQDGGGFVPGQPGAHATVVTTTTTTPPGVPEGYGAKVYDSPDGFGDVTAYCIGPNGVYLTRTGPLAVISDDPNCTGDTRALTTVPPAGRYDDN